MPPPDRSPVLVTGPDGALFPLERGESVVFGRGTQTDIPLGGDPWLSRTAGRIAAVDGGALISNLSGRHSLYVLIRSERLRLPVTTENGGLGFLLAEGGALVGTAPMLDHGRALDVRTAGGTPPPAPPPDTPSQETTGLPVRLDPATKEFMVAFLLCRPWLLDPTRMAPLPRAPELARQALELTGAHHLLRGFDGSAARGRLAQQVHDHLKELRAKIYRAGLVGRDQQLSLSAIASALLHYDVIGLRHLELARDPAWLTAQENKWWKSG
ncbi:hypothetical protein [Actinocorallia aurantiaca]|jgi:hypothetical protein|uniref:FHA domain-containing protein n=1 Tax=Actinocorallia aurantiaca TaxID=46204 RepID=A0ABP6GZ70_9ACTN